MTIRQHQPDEFGFGPDARCADNCPGCLPDRPFVKTYSQLEEENAKLRAIVDCPSCDNSKEVWDRNYGDYVTCMVCFPLIEARDKAKLVK